MARDSGLQLILYKNPGAEARGINQITHGSAVHTDMWKTQGLKQALDQSGYDVAFGGARRGGEQERGRGGGFPCRNAPQRWDPGNRGPGFVQTYSTQTR